MLLEVFNNRFHVPLSVKVGYLPPKKKSALEFNDLLLQAEVDEIIERNEALRKRNRRKPGNQRMVEMILERRSLRLFRRCRKRSGLEKR